jgi:hypothetical protein
MHDETVTTLGPDYWELACRVLLECGRARVHSLRNALNAVSLGVELLNGESAEHTGARTAGLRQQVTEAAAEIEGLQTLILEAAQPHIHTLPEAAGWALNMTKPVARRRSVEFVVPSSLWDLPSVTVNDGFSVALGELLLTACLASDRGQKCMVTSQRNRDVMLAVEWTAGHDAASERLVVAHDMLSRAMKPNGSIDLAGDGSRQRMTMCFQAVA